jgi:signal transduction histidine kinase
MEEIVADVRQRLEDMITTRKAEITIPGEWPEAVGYAPWVEEIWINYVSNALKYGGQSPQIELGSNRLSNGSVRFWVRDSGPGISPEQQKELFTPFSRLGQSPKIEGHGLGLSIVLRIAEKLGGEVGVESQVDQGSLFFFTLPTAIPEKVSSEK